MAENFLNLWEDVNLQIQGGEQISNRIKPKKSMSKHIIIKVLKTTTKDTSWKKPEKNDTLPLGERDLFMTVDQKPWDLEGSKMIFKCCKERSMQIL